MTEKAWVVADTFSIREWTYYFDEVVTEDLFAARGVKPAEIKAKVDSGRLIVLTEAERARRAADEAEKKAAAERAEEARRAQRQRIEEAQRQAHQNIEVTNIISASGHLAAFTKPPAAIDVQAFTAPPPASSDSSDGGSGGGGGTD